MFHLAREAYIGTRRRDESSRSVGATEDKRRLVTLEWRRASKRNSIAYFALASHIVQTYFALRIYISYHAVMFPPTYALHIWTVIHQRDAVRYGKKYREIAVAITGPTFRRASEGRADARDCKTCSVRTERVPGALICASYIRRADGGFNLTIASAC